MIPIGSNHLHGVYWAIFAYRILAIIWRRSFRMYSMFVLVCIIASTMSVSWDMAEMNDIRFVSNCWFLFHLSFYQTPYLGSFYYICRTNPFSALPITLTLFPFPGRLILKPIYMARQGDTSSFVVNLREYIVNRIQCQPTRNIREPRRIIKLRSCMRKSFILPAYAAC